MAYPTEPTSSVRHEVLPFPDGTTYSGTMVQPGDLIANAGNGFQADPTNGVFVLTSLDSLLELYPIIRGNDNALADFVIYRVPLPIMPDTKNGLKKSQFSPVKVLSFTASACTRTGVANGIITDSWRYCDDRSNEVIRDPSTGVLWIGPTAGAGDNEKAGYSIDGRGVFQWIVCIKVGAGATAASFVARGLNTA
jgi:hypothetical protein